MPRYTNTGTDRQIIGQDFIEPNGGILDSEVYFDTLPSGVTMDRTIRNFNKVLLDTTLTANATVTVPTGTKSYRVTIAAVNGNCSIYLNDLSNTPPLKLVQGSVKVYQCNNRVIDTIIIAAMSGNAIQVTIERM